MRILQVVHQYGPHYVGGTEIHTESLARGLAAVGHSVAVLTRVRRASASECVVRSEAADGVTVYRLYAPEPRGTYAAFQDSFQNTTALTAFKRVLSEHRPDVVHIHHLKGLHHGIADLARELRIPQVLTLHDYWYFCGTWQLLRTQGNVCGGPRLWLNCVDCAAHRTGTRLLWGAAPAVAALLAYRERVLARVVQQADRVIAPSEYVRARYAARYALAERLQLLGHGIDPLPVNNPAPRDPAAPLRVLFAGGLSVPKGAHILVEAVRTLPPNRIRLDICGDESTFQEYAARLKASAQGLPVRFHGPLNHTQLGERMSDSDVLAVPSIWPETASLVALEARAAGLPIIASDIGALPERVHEDGDGWLVPAGDQHAWNSALRGLVENVQAVTGKRHARALSSSAAHTTRILSVYKDIVAVSPQSSM